jgi:tetratricopeptide (TPR) repeat protein
VYRILDRVLDREVALKVVGPDESNWLRREFDTLRQIRHENLIRVLLWEPLASGGSYYTMEFIDGSDLGRIMGNPLPAEEVRRVLAGLLRGLGHLHCHGEIHGDLKPGNVLLGSGGVVKVADVGMRGDASSRELGSATVGYTAPEVWAREPTTQRGDLYSVGVIGYEMLTGKHPFGARTVREVLSGQLEGWVPSPSAYGVSVPDDLERAIMRALERDPELRQGSADEFLEGLGAENRVGEILGGRFVNRADEMSHLEQFAASVTPKTPTLLYIAGPSGVGKSMLLREAAARSASWQASLHELRDPETDIAELTGDHGTVNGTATIANASERISVVADRLISRFQGARGLLLEDPASPSDYVRDAARYVWAEAAERKAAPNVRFIRVVHSAPTSLEAFEYCLVLSPFESERAGQLVSGILGNGDISQQFLERLVAETGGLPESLAVTTLELVDRQLMARRFGHWQVASISEGDWESLKTNTSRWERSWGRLSERERDLLTAITATRAGLTVADLQRAFGDIDVEAAAARLQTFGWAASHEAKLVPSSREAERVVLDSKNSLRQGIVSQKLLMELGNDLPRPVTARLLLNGAPSAEAVREGLWLGAHLREQRHYTESVRALLTTRDLSLALGDAGSARSASLTAAEGLLRSGANDEVLALLSRGDEWDTPEQDPKKSIERSRILGLSCKARGDLEGARANFEYCSREGKRSGDRRLWLLAEAELAEIEWRHGGEEGRQSAAKRVQELTATAQSFEDCRDEWAALRYQHGASLVVAGRREESLAILEEALRLAESDYWRMRIGNALAAANYYLGNFRVALAAADLAWQNAVEGEVDSFKPRILASMAGIRFGLGMFREAAEQDQMAAFWGRRIGNPFEYEAGLLAATSDLIHLGQFERAIAYASEVRGVDSGRPNSRHVAKAYEMEALTLIHVGNYAAAQDCIAKAYHAIEGKGFDDLIPRLCWHAARIEMEFGRFVSGEAKLREALQSLEKTKDWEDLPGVKVEMQVLFARAGDRRADAGELRILHGEARSREIGLVQLRATLALGEIAFLIPSKPVDVVDTLLDGLRLAERSGAREFVWRLSYWIARILHESGDLRGAATRISNAIRVIREVASELTPEHRASYLSTSQARLLLTEAGLVTDSTRAQPD